MQFALNDFLCYTDGKMMSGEAVCTMDLKVSEMMKYQQMLQEKHPEWGGLYPKRAQEQILWGICEIGEACQLIKKLGPERVKSDEKIRGEFIEEIGDVMMYFWDALLCLGVTPEEFSQVYAKKCERNLGRDWVKEHNRKYGENEVTKKFWEDPNA